jgi:hypothetical protein
MMYGNQGPRSGGGSGGGDYGGRSPAVSGEWSPACVASPRRGYRRVRVVPGGETRGVCGFQPSRMWQLTLVCSPGFP